VAEQFLEKDAYMLKLQAKALKATVVLDPAALVGLVVPNGQAKFPVSVEVAGRVIKAELNSKSLRRNVVAIEAAGPAAVACVLSGKLEGDELMEAGLQVMPKAPKPAEPAAGG
jgi:hypothetical protein